MIGEPKPPIKSVIVAAGTGSPGIKQINILATGPTGPTQLPQWTQVTGPGYPANIPTIQATNSFVAGLKSVVIPNYSSASGFDFNFATGVSTGSVASNFSAVNSGGFAQNTNGTLNTFGPNQLRISTQGLLIEAAATNLQVNTAAFAGFTGSHATAVATAGPDGSNNAITLTDDATTNAHQTFLNSNITVANTTTYTASVYAKAGSVQFLQLTFQFAAFSGAGYADFDLTNGIISGSGGTLVNSGITQYPNGWCRCWIVATSTAGTSTNPGFNMIMQTSGTATRNATYAGTGTGTISLFGPQMETGTFPSSYIVSGASATTRTADNISINGPLLNLLQTGAGRVAFSTNFMPGSLAATLIGIGSGTAVLMAVNASNQLITNLGNLTNTGADTWTGAHTAYGAWNATRGSAVRVLNNTSPASGQGVVANSGTTATLGSNGNGTNYLNGYVTHFAAVTRPANQPPLAAVMFYDRNTFFDDFLSISTIDVNNTQAAGFNWYPNNQWPNAGQTGYRSIGPTPAAAFGVSGSVLTITDVSHFSLVSATPVLPSGTTYTGFVAAGPTGAFFEVLMAFNPANARNGQGSWPAFWTHGLRSWVDPTQTEYPEIDFFEASPNGTGAINQIATDHDWTIASGTNNSNANNNAMAVTGMTGATQTAFNYIGKLWIPMAANGGATGIFLSTFNGTSLPGNRELYGSGPAQPAFTPSNPNGTLYVVENDLLPLILAAGQSGAFNAEFDSVSVWQQ